MTADWAHTSSALCACGVTARLGGRSVLRDVSLEVRPGQVLAVVGPNGAGKSTLLRAMAGDVSPHSGEVRLDGRPLKAWLPVQLAQRRAVLLQDTTLSFPFNALDVTLMGRAPHCRGAERPVDYAIARQALALVEASHLEERVYPSLSGGERQRVQLARVLAQVLEPAAGAIDSAAPSHVPPRYLLLDEPISSLDIAHQHAALDIARRLSREEVGVLVILHDLNLAAQYADRIVVLNEGQVVSSGEPRQVLTPQLIERVFGIPVHVLVHPLRGCPLIVPTPAIDDWYRDE